MAKVDVIMPQMGESIAEGTLTKWLKKVGEGIERDEDLFEISTDKVDADIPAPASGVLAEVLVEEGQTVEVNTVVARIETDAAAAAPPEGREAPRDAEPAGAEPAGAEPARGEGAEPEGEADAEEWERRPAATMEARERAAAPEGDGAMTREERLRTRSTPLVRKIAAEHGVDIEEVEGSGVAGRVTRDDILAYIGQREEEAAAATERERAAVRTREEVPAAKREVKAPKREEVTAPTREEVTAPARRVAQPSAPAPAAERAPAAAAASEEAAPGTMRVPIHGATLDIKLPRVPIRENDRVEDMSRVRLRTMEHMLMSTRVSAHVTSVTEIDFERVVRLRKKLKPKFEERGVKLTYGPFIMKAVIEGLQEYPILNASVDGTRIVYHGDINLGIAVSVNDGKELIVPVLKNADRLSLLGLAQGANELAEKARTRNLDFDDIQGGTFTITNVGVFGNLFGTPIINQPQVAILGTGVIEKRPVVAQDDMENDVIAIRHRSYFGLSYDHRVVDGAMAAFFLNKVQEVIENFREENV